MQTSKLDRLKEISKGEITMDAGQKIDILKIKEAAQRAKAYGMNISEYTIRRAIGSGQLPCRIIGRTYLISWQKLVEWATCADGCDNPV